MTAQYIAARLLSAHGPSAAKRRIGYRLLTYRRLIDCVRPEDLAHYYARVMLWRAVRFHVVNATH